MTTRTHDDMDELIDGASVAELSRVLVRARKRMRALAVDSNPMLQGAVLDPLIGYMIKTHSMHALTKLVKACALLGPNMAEMIGTLLGSEGRCKLLMGPSLRRVETIVLAKAFLHKEDMNFAYVGAWLTCTPSSPSVCLGRESTRHGMILGGGLDIRTFTRAASDSKRDWMQVHLHVKVTSITSLLRYIDDAITVVVSIPTHVPDASKKCGKRKIRKEELRHTIIDASGYGPPRTWATDDLGY
jgi:hypothetical protein